MAELNENVVEWITGEEYGWYMITEKPLKKRIKQLYKTRKDRFMHYKENKDGSIYVCMPHAWLKVNPEKKSKPEMTEEQKNTARENLSKAREKRTRKV